MKRIRLHQLSHSDEWYCKSILSPAPTSTWDLGTNSCPAERTAAVAGEVSASSRRTGRLGHLSFTLRVLPFGCEKLIHAEIRILHDFATLGSCPYYIRVTKSHVSVSTGRAFQGGNSPLQFATTCNKLATWAAGLFVETSVGCYQRA